MGESTSSRALFWIPKKLVFFRKGRKMPPKSNNQKKKEAEAAGKAPKKTKQQERPLLERRKKCKPREPLKGKRNQGLGKMDTCKKQFKCDRRLDISLDRRQIPKPPTEEED